jgi:predicted ATPase/DNA-binding NarL/FixJ family response regulator
MRLFADRAAAARPGFRLTPDNAGAVERVCRALDGMPLAIELAAARVRALSVAQIADRLIDRFRLLDSGERTAPRRQQTLRAAVDWSYELLTPPEQALLRRLSVFAGWSLEAAEQVCSDDLIPPADVLDLLTALIDKSLVTIDGELNGRVRYRLLDTIREYAAGQAAEAGETERLRRRQRDYMLALYESMVASAFVRGDPPWPDRVAMYWLATSERPNCIAALAYCHEHGDAEEGMRLCFSMRSTWLADGDATQGAAWLDRFLALDQVVAAGVRGRALSVRAELAFEQQDYAAAEQAARDCLRVSRAERAGNEAGGSRLLGLIALRAGRTDEALASVDAAIAAARAAGDDWEDGVALTARATVIARAGRLDEAHHAFDSAIEVLRDNNGWGVAQARYGSGRLAMARGDAEAAVRHFAAALALYRQIDVRPEMARCLAGIGAVALAQGDLPLARSSLRESLQLSLATGQRLAVARGLEATAALAAVAGDLARAVRLAGAALALREAIGDRPSPAATGQLDQLLAAARASLGAAAAGALLAEGRAMSPDAAAQAAAAGQHREAGEPAAAPGPEPGPAGATVPAARPPGAAPEDRPDHLAGAGPLTGRERQVAGLVTTGMSNRAIAAALVISPATVARHVANIFAKLGFSSRSQIAAWMAGHADTDARDDGANAGGAPDGGRRSGPGPAERRTGDRRAHRAVHGSPGGADTYPDT